MNLPNNKLTTAYIDLILSRRWKELLAWIVFHPEELLYADKRNQTVLHHACLFRAPAQVIEMLLYQKPELASVANVDYEIPLHWAIRLSAPNEIIQLLLSVHPSSACCKKDKDGNTALSMVWERNESFLLDQWWQFGKTTLSRSKCWTEILFFFQCYSYYLKVERAAASSNEYDCLEEIEKHKKSFRPLHTATQCPSCPLMLFMFLLRVYKDDIREPDDNGRLPLTLACSDPVSNRSVGVLTKVHLLLADYPTAVLLPDYQGRLPLYIALESGLMWNEGIDRLISFDTKTLLLCDTITGLPAFLLAAAKKSICIAEREQQVYWEYAQLTTIFSILRTDPSQLNIVIKV